MSYSQPYQNIIIGYYYHKYELCDIEKDKGYGQKKLFGSKWEALIREWRKLLDGELQDKLLNQYWPGEELKQKKMGGACGMNMRE
jgi:hypothetical protein